MIAAAAQESKIVIHPNTYEEFYSQLQPRDAFDNTTLSLWSTCHRKFLFQEEWKLDVQEEAAALTYGSAIHDALYHYHLGDSEQNSIKAFVARCSVPESIIDLELDVDDTKQKYSIEWGVWLLTKYFEHYKKDQDQYETVVDSCGKPYLEVGFAVEAGDGIFVGRIDRIMRDRDTKELWLEDHKTTQKPLNQSYWQQFNPNNQIAGYMWAVREILGELPAGCVINGIRVYQFKRLKEEDFPETVFSRCWTNRSEDQVLDRGRQIRQTISEIRAARKTGLDAYPLNAPVACNLYGRVCEFIPLCMSRSQVVVQNVAAANYKRREWQPYSELADAKDFRIVQKPPEK